MITAAKVNKWADEITEIEDDLWREKQQPSKAASRLWALIHEMRAEAARLAELDAKIPAPWEAPYREGERQ